MYAAFLYIKVCIILFYLFVQSMNITSVCIRFIMIHHSQRKYFLIIPLHHHQTNHDSPEQS